MKKFINLNVYPEHDRRMFNIALNPDIISHIMRYDIIVEGNDVKQGVYELKLIVPIQLSKDGGYVHTSLLVFEKEFDEFKCAFME